MAIQFTLPVSGGDPVLVSRADFEASIQEVIDALQSEIGAAAAGLSPAGSWDAASGSFPAGAAYRTYYIVNNAGVVDGVSFAVGDWLIPLRSDASTTSFADWIVGRYGPRDETPEAEQIVGQADGRAFDSTAAITSTAGLLDGQIVSFAGREYLYSPTVDYPNDGETTIATADGQLVLRRADYFSTMGRFRGAINRGAVWPIGSVVNVDGLKYEYRGDGATAIAGLNGWHPVAPIRVEHFGAVADGATDNRAAIQAAANYAANSPTRTLHFGQGIYEVGSGGTGTCILVPNWLTLSGAGRFKTIIRRQAGAIAHVINTPNGANNITIQDMEIDGNKAGDPAGVAGVHCVRTFGISHFRMERVTLKNAIYYGYGEQGAASIAVDIQLEDVLIDRCGGRSSEGTAMGDGLDVKSVRGMKLVRCTSQNNAQKGFDIRGQGLIYDTCRAYGNGSDGFTARNSSVGIVTDVRVVNCESIDNGSTGLSISDEGISGEIGYAQINGGKFDYNAAHGISNSAASISMMVEGAKAIVNGGSGVRSLSARGSVTGCFLLGNTSYGYDNGGTDLKQIVTSNQANGNTAGNIRTPGTSAIHANNLTA